MTYYESATWGQVEPGDTVLGADHHEWTVTNVHGAAVTMQRPGRDPIVGRPPASRAVQRRPGPAALELAAALAALSTRFHVEHVRDSIEPVWLGSGTRGKVGR